MGFLGEILPLGKPKILKLQLLQKAFWGKTQKIHQISRDTMLRSPYFDFWCSLSQSQI
jgi:hypothetical protein